MVQDTSTQQDHLYDIAHRAQEKAAQARQRRIKRRSRAAGLGRKDGAELTEMPDQDTYGSTTQRRGMRGEEQAARYLHKQGLRVLARNIHCRAGEIDLVATDGHTLIFVEVRLRKSAEYGGAAASVDLDKQRRLINTARFFLPRFSACCFGGTSPPCRFDVISIDGQQLRWIRHAFEAE